MKRLRQLREQRGYSLRKLAEVSRVHFVSLARLEAGELDPRLSTVRKLAKALGVTVAELIGEAKKGGR